MFWADAIAKDIKKRNLPLEWVDDMKTPSGRIHVGSLRGVVIHDLIYKCLLDQKVNTKYTYIFDDQDPMDGLPVYLDQEKYKKYMGMPLFKVPSPEEGYKNYGEFFAKEFQNVFNAIGCEPDIIWSSNLYGSGKMNGVIKEALDNAKAIKKIYEEIYEKEIADPWYPFQPYCENCGKVSTTTVTNWDGEKITYSCDVNKVKFTTGCGHTGEMSPFSGDGKVVGKLPWKVEWSAKWKVIGVTVEGAGKDHMTKGGSHDVTSKISENVFKYPVPYELPYEFFVLGKQKMSSSKGIGASSKEMLEILPAALLRFLMVRTRINSEINFDLSNPNTIPTLFDEYQRAADAYFSKTDEDLSRIFELSQINGKVIKPPTIRFSVLSQWVQMPNMQEEIKNQNLQDWEKYANVWIERFAPETDKFSFQENIPKEVVGLSEKQRDFLKQVAQEIEKVEDPEEFQKKIYDLGKNLGLSSQEGFSAIYLSLLGKNHGPKASWLILSNKDFVKKRFTEI